MCNKRSLHRHVYHSWSYGQSGNLGLMDDQLHNQYISNPLPQQFFPCPFPWQSFHRQLTILSTVLSKIMSKILSKVLSKILSTILSKILPHFVMLDRHFILSFKHIECLHEAVHCSSPFCLVCQPWNRTGHQLEGVHIHVVYPCLTATHLSLIFEFFKCLPFRMCLAYSSETWLCY